MYIYQLDNQLGGNCFKSGLTDPKHMFLVSPIYESMILSNNIINISRAKIIQSIKQVREFIVMVSEEHITIFRDTILKDLLVFNGDQVYLKIGDLMGSSIRRFNSCKNVSNLYTIDINDDEFNLYHYNQDIQHPVVYSMPLTNLKNDKILNDISNSRAFLKNVRGGNVL